MKEKIFFSEKNQKKNFKSLFFVFIFSRENKMNGGPMNMTMVDKPILFILLFNDAAKE
jgi:hypothetical protein